MVFNEFSFIHLIIKFNLKMFPQKLSVPSDKGKGTTINNILIQKMRKLKSFFVYNCITFIVDDRRIDNIIIIVNNKIITSLNSK